MYTRESQVRTHKSVKVPQELTLANERMHLAAEIIGNLLLVIPVHMLNRVENVQLGDFTTSIFISDRTASV